MILTGSDLCLSDRFHERNSFSDIKYLRRINNIPQHNSVVNSQVQEQLHLRFDKNKSFLNMMKPANHIFLFRSIINYSSENQGPLSDEVSYISSYASSLSNSEPFSYTPDNLIDHFDAATYELWPVAYSLRMTIGDKRQIMDRRSLNVNIISLVMRLLPYLKDQVFCWNDLLNVGTSDVWKYLNDKKFVQILPLN